MGRLTLTVRTPTSLSGTQPRRYQPNATAAAATPSAHSTTPTRLAVRLAFVNAEPGPVYAENLASGRKGDGFPACGERTVSELMAESPLTARDTTQSGGSD